MKLFPYRLRQIAVFTLIVSGLSTGSAQILLCPPDIDLECDEAIPAPDPSLVSIDSYCKLPNFCDDLLQIADYCTANTSGCMQVALTCVDVTANCEPIFQFKVYNTCQQALSNIAFTLPSGTTGTSPEDGDTYISPCGDSWFVETPTGGPDAGTIKFEGQLNQGESTGFEFILYGLERIPDQLTVNPKYGPNDVFYQISTFGCGNSGFDAPTHKGDKPRPIGCLGEGACRIYEVNFHCPVVVSGRSLCEQIIIKEDDFTAPVYDFVPSDQTLSCGEPVVFTPPTATDDCGTVTIEVMGNGELGGCPGETIYVRRWKARDDCFNYSPPVEQRLTVPANCCPVNFHEAPENATQTGDRLSLTVFPNPAPGAIELRFEGPLAGDSEVSIFTPDGRQVYRAAASTVNQPIALPDGIYFVQLRSDDQLLTQRVVVQE